MTQTSELLTILTTCPGGLLKVICTDVCVCGSRFSVSDLEDHRGGLHVQKTQGNDAVMEKLPPERP